jgi:chromosome segregation ATPase
MTPEQMERAIEAMLAQNTQFNESLDRVRAVVERLSESHVKSIDEIQEVRQAQAQTASDMQLLTGKIIDLTDNISRLEDNVSRLEAQSEIDRAEIREAINNLIVANERTRKLTEDVARLHVQTSQRVTGLDQRVTDLEQKQ